MRKRAISLVLALTVLLTLSACGGGKKLRDETPQKFYKEDGSSYAFRTNGRYLERYQDGEFVQYYVQGVNIGSGKPNNFPGEMGITKQEYLTWFRQISEMHANAVRVYTVLSPAFYEAFYEYNATHEEKLYLFQGCWYDETILEQYGDAYKTLDGVKKDLKDLVDIFHGRAKIAERPGHASGAYTWDISNYVAGWILGIEPDAELVEATNGINSENTGYEGNYLRCADVQPYEAFWCQIGDYVLEYEDKKYHVQRPISFTNWPTADVMEHPNEPLMAEDAVSLNVEVLSTGPSLHAGLFASYHIYPHYPNFMYTSPEYASYVDDEGKPNTYRAYLEDLMSYHTLPVLVAEFGVPASRGIAHINSVTGFNQGGHTDQEQGEMLISMFKDIKKSGYAGGLVFSWQDEWFKKVWNTKDYNDAERRAYWNDVQTCEQHYGLLEFLSQDTWPTPIIDGDTGDWMEENLVVEGAHGEKIYSKADSTYLYVMVNAPGADWSKPGDLLYFDITPGVGAERYGDRSLPIPVDLVMDIGGKDGTRLRIHRDSDFYHYINRVHDKKVAAEFESSEDGFGPIYLVTDYSHILPQQGVAVSTQRIETGLLRFGTNDETSQDYDPLTDFCYSGDVLEVRIPWQLLGFRDPSRKEVQGYFLSTGTVGGVKVDGITLGLLTPEGDAGCGFTTWDNWSEAVTYPRLRRSYYMLREYLASEG